MRKNYYAFQKYNPQKLYHKTPHLPLMRILIISASAAREGFTKKLVQQIQPLLHADVTDLNDYHIMPYQYGAANTEDDYYKLIKHCIENYDIFIFATPVYWYAMSGSMKTFFDRFTDLLDHYKDLGRQLRTKRMAAISTSAGDNLGEAFWLPFSEAARYLGMQYLGHLHTLENEVATENLQKFCNQVKKS